MESETRRRWSRDELVIAFNLYCRTPFGRLHKSNPDLIQLAKILGRTPSALAMKLVNFASMDPVQKARNIRGLSHASKADHDVWSEFHEDWTQLAIQSEEAISQLDSDGRLVSAAQYLDRREGHLTETIRETRVRLVQSFFRKAVLAAYDYECVICKLDITTLLVASHIIPWSKDERRRADPTNGLALCVLHDRAFDVGMITFDESNRVRLSPKAKSSSKSKLQEIALVQIEGQPLALPSRFRPDGEALKYHRERIFQG